MLEYRIKIKPGIAPPEKPPQYLRDIRARQPMVVAGAMPNADGLNTLRELMDMELVRAVDSSASIGSTVAGNHTRRKSDPRSRNRS